MTQKSDASGRLAAASARLLELAEKGESSVATDLLRRFVSVRQNAVGAEDNHASPDTTETVWNLRRDADEFADVKRMRDAIDVALALLDEVLQLVPPEPRKGVAQDIADIFHEISEIASLGESAARKALEE